MKKKPYKKPSSFIAEAQKKFENSFVKSEKQNPTCSFCLKKFANANFLQKHIQSNHENKVDQLIQNEMKNQTCGLCLKKFVNASYLERHIQIKHGNNSDQKFEKHLLSAEALKIFEKSFVKSKENSESEEKDPLSFL